MYMLLSPSKTLDFDTPVTTQQSTSPSLLEDSKKLVQEAQKLSTLDIMSLMDVSEKIARTNYERFQQFTTPFTPANARQALFAFKGDVYDKMDVADYTEDDLAFVQAHLGILSGLYGLLRPLDLMQAYRLEMGRKFAADGAKNLYEFWSSRITDLINKHAQGPIINLASQEYFKAVKPKELKQPLYTVTFKQHKGGKLKTIGLMAKRARGMMANYIIKNRIDNIEDLKNFKQEGYAFMPDLSSEKEYVFVLNMDV